LIRLDAHNSRRGRTTKSSSAKEVGSVGEIGVELALLVPASLRPGIEDRVRVVFGVVVAILLLGFLGLLLRELLLESALLLWWCYYGLRFFLFLFT
jgi:hypothetical protein